jgi:hypothetical protein
MTSAEIIASPDEPCPVSSCTHGDLYFGRPICNYPREALIAIILRQEDSHRSEIAIRDSGLNLLRRR